MGLLKTALIAGGILLGVGAVGGITAAVVTRQNAQTSLPANSNENKNPSQSEGVENTNTALSVLNSIQPTDIVVKDQNGQKQTSDFYAFDLAKNPLEISSAKKIPTGYSVSIKIKEKGSISDLNDGKLKVSITVENSANKDVQEKEVELTTFKKIDQSLKDLFDKKNGEEEMMQTDSSYVLSLIPTKQKAATFISIEELNKNTSPTIQENRNTQTSTNGLTTWLANSEKAEKAKGVSIEGKVKVGSISKLQDGTTIFELVPINHDQLLKLVKKENDKTLQALVGSFKTTNLLADKVSVNVVGVDKQASAEFQKTLLERTKPDSSNGFKDTKDELQINITRKMPTPETSSDVNLIASVFKNKETDGSIKIPLSLKVTFGKGDEATSFDTTNSEQAMMLQKAGFSFHIYTRYLADHDAKTAENLMASHIQDGSHDLSKYFVTTNYNTPIAKPDTETLKGDLNAISNGNFYVLGPVTKDFQDNTTLETKNWTSSDKRNYLFFADYSYVAARNSTTHALHEKVLFSPYLSLVNVLKQTIPV